MLVMERPSSLTIDPAELAIPRGVILMGIHVHSNTFISFLSMYPKPEGLVVDSTKMMITGQYTGTWIGVRNITLRASNSYGVVECVIPFVFTGSLAFPPPP